MKSSSIENEVENSYNVLVVEDDESLNHLIQTNLQRAGLCSEGALNGTNAIAKMVENPNRTLLLLDYALPDMTGKDIIEAFKKSRYDVPFIVMTGHGDEKTAVEMMKLGARDYLPKEGDFTTRLTQVVKRTMHELATEKELVKAEAALQESNEKVQLLIKNVNDAIFRFETDKGYTFMSPSIENLLGYKPEDYYNYPVFFKRITHPGDLPVMEDLLSSLKEGKEPPKRFELRQFHEDGHLVHLEFGFTAIRNDKGEIVALEGVARDITERKKMEQKLCSTLKELKAKNQELDDFVYMSSHDLKEPLITIQGLAGLLKKNHRKELSEEALSYVNAIITDAEDMNDLVTDLLALSRAGKGTLSKSHLNLSEIVNSSLQSLQGRIDEKKAEMIVRDEYKEVNYDPTLLKEVFTNLLSNALKYSKSGERPRVEVGWSDAADEIVVSVRDNGIGIKKEHWDTIFQPFERVDLRQKGSGIGLSIVRKIVERHEGRLWIDSKFDEGSTFYFTIPKLYAQSSP